MDTAGSYIGLATHDITEYDAVTDTTTYTFPDGSVITEDLTQGIYSGVMADGTEGSFSLTGEFTVTATDGTVYSSMGDNILYTDNTDGTSTAVDV